MAIKHGVHDTDTHFIIDPITRAAKNDGQKKVSIVRDDHNSEVCTFELPRYVEGHDMSQCNKVEVHYLNTHGTTKAKSTGIYEVADFRLKEDDENTVVGSWLIDCLATKYPGSLAFSIHFACVDETGVVAYWWSSATNTSISVLDSINLTESSGGGGGSEEESDLQEKIATPAKTPQVVRPDNGYYGLSKVTVEAIPEEYVAPVGSKFIGANGSHDVKKYESVLVNVPPKLQDKTVTANGTYTASDGYDGIGAVNVNISDAPATLQEKRVYPASFDQSVEPDEGFDGLSRVSVGAMKLQSVTVEKNGEVVPSHGFDALSSVTVNVPELQPNLQDKVMTFTENGTVKIEPDRGFTGLGSVEVEVEVESVGNLQTKVIRDNGEHKPDEEYDGFELVKVEVPQYVYTGVEKAAGDVPVYGGEATQFIIIDGESAMAKGYLDDLEAPLVTSLSFSEVTTGAAISTAVGSATFNMSIEKNVSGTGEVSYSVTFKQGDQNLTKAMTWDLGQTGFRLFWSNVYPPGYNAAFPNGCAGIGIILTWVPDKNTMQVKKSTLYGRYAGFKSEDEYYAAMDLVIEPKSIVEISGTVVFPPVDERTEAE